MTPLEFKLIDNQLDQLTLPTKNTRDEHNFTLKHIEQLKQHLTKAFETQPQESLKSTIEIELPQEHTKPSDLVKMKEVIHMTGLSRSSIYSLMNKNEFPKSINLEVRSAT